MKIDADRFEAESHADRELNVKPSSLHRISSANINIPLKKCASERFAPRVRRVSSRHRYFNSNDNNAEGKCSDEYDREPQSKSSDMSTLSSSWRKQQRECANCGQIFFRSMPNDTERLGAYCSLDCKTSHGYMKSVHVSVDAQLSSLVDTWVDDGCSSSSSSTSKYASIKEGGDIETE